ncbi:flagellar motor switch phosphatase FliY [Caldicoprobacter algeriensis]|uniref:flagellar motor switch phosphatase FliY n=1 Tax=Caldicoprobacter algeriensis TaxID=699281 RepID=UPI00207A6CE5|nr:flagellar motor switch phosphatase FliY [Caldicoprobacter algeriensis]MCM8901207.1 flagellar motor switch phosphatase FliY [Caldicoprobacter algeriensis]
MNDMLSQEEIDALLRDQAIVMQPSQQLAPEEIDALGEIGNISMGTAATTLSTLIGKKVIITTPEVTITTIRELAKQYPIPFIAAEVQYTEGLEGTNILIMQERDVKIITDLMMGGDGTNIEGEISDLHLSAIGEVMNQMMGSACTSLSTMFNKSILISPPNTFVMDFTSDFPYTLFKSDEPIVRINFKMVVEGLIDSYIMQLLPIDFAKELLSNLLGGYDQQTTHQTVEQQSSAVSLYSELSQTPQNSSRLQEQRDSYDTPKAKPINVQPVSFQPLEEKPTSGGKSNLDLILDVPLQVSVELGRTRKLVKEILELTTGSVIELDKMAGEPVDVLVNGKVIAKGEVVVIDDSFGVRITDIISPAKRISSLK